MMTSNSRPLSIFLLLNSVPQPLVLRSVFSPFWKFFLVRCIVQTHSYGRNSVSHLLEDPISAVSRVVSNFVPRALRDLYVPLLLSKIPLYVSCFVLSLLLNSDLTSDEEFLESWRCNQNLSLISIIMEPYVLLHASHIPGFYLEQSLK